MSRSRPGYRALILPASLIAILVALIMAAACAPLYTPNALHTNLPRKSGTVQAAATYGAGMFNGNIDVAPIDDVSIIGSYSYEPWSFGKQEIASDDSVWARHRAHQFWEAGLGYSMALDATQLDLLAGFGMGRAAALWPQDSTALASIYPILSDSGDVSNNLYRVDGSYRRIFVQATVSDPSREAVKNGFTGYEGFALRASYVWFTDLTRENRSTLHPRALFFDPIAFVRSGGKNIQFELQGGFSVKVPLNNDQLRVQVIFIELGVHAVLDGLW